MSQLELGHEADGPARGWGRAGRTTESLVTVLFTRWRMGSGTGKAAFLSLSGHWHLDANFQQSWLALCCPRSEQMRSFKDVFQSMVPFKYMFYFPDIAIVCESVDKYEVRGHLSGVGSHLPSWVLGSGLHGKCLYH